LGGAFIDVPSVELSATPSGVVLNQTPIAALLDGLVDLTPGGITFPGGEVTFAPGEITFPGGAVTFTDNGVTFPGGAVTFTENGIAFPGGEVTFF
jgi:hypothetical protein